jgi:hypothetical protein
LCLFLCGGVPVLIPLGFINLFSRYIANRSLLQNNSSKIEGLSESFSSIPLLFLPIALVVCPLVSEWMLTANSSIYPNGISVSLSIFTNFA